MSVGLPDPVHGVEICAERVLNQGEKEPDRNERRS